MFSVFLLCSNDVLLVFQWCSYWASKMLYLCSNDVLIVCTCIPLKEPYWRENNFPAKIFQMIIIQSLLKFLKSKLLLLFWFVFISIIHHPCANKIRNNEIEIPQVGPWASLNARYRIAPLKSKISLLKVRRDSGASQWFLDVL